ncbi:MAG: thioredoxin domain-containing protein [Candidatus Sulfopaludibacter sp.]|nr:thioredoxin domain-containing protein [Candidatus Sulfopaludibacter sp.]
MHTNRLANEKSPYLLQHAHNPVDWYAWSPEAFEKARAENKPIFLSVGYSTCHWCHVMERESFESDKIAALLNEHYVPIKVDREERPDVDRIYMTFVQATTGGGGWPMSVWLTPELEPFFGGTYFPPENRYGHPGFASILRQIAEAWTSDRPQILTSARDIVRQLQEQVTVEPSASGVLTVDHGVLDSGFNVFRRTFDPQLGGFGGAPKFPRPSVYRFLLRYHARTNNREALEMVLLTLREMAKGGMNDQLGGGFHRYSVDERWFVPHFEKMLYDQAQLAIAYLEAFQISGDGNYADVARRIFDYVLRDMTAPEGGFYSAEDADSVIVPEEPGLKGEGAFYIWSADEIRELVPEPAASWFCYRYGVADGGNVASDPHGEFTGKNILYQSMTLDETAQQFERPVEEIDAGIAEAERILLRARAGRVRPQLDDKILTGWNGLMISAFALGGAVLREARYAEAARRAAEFLATSMYSAETGYLMRRYRQGEAAIPGFLDDYAMAAQGLLDLYEAQFDLRHLQIAIRLTEKQRELFEDRKHGGFFSTDARDSSLVIMVKEDYDGAEPSGNSVAALNLLRLAQITGRAEFRESAGRLLAAFGPRLIAAPVALPQMLVACEFFLSEPREIVLVGEKGAADTEALARTVHERFGAGRVLMLVESEETRAFLAAGNGAIRSMTTLDGRAAAYVCRNYACKLPVAEVGALAELLQ